MKPAPFALCVMRIALLGTILSAPAAFAAEDGTPSRTSAPQARVRLATALRASPTATDATPPGDGAVVMEKMVVRESPLPAAPRPLEPESTTLTLARGGPAFKNRLGSTLAEFGLWPLAEANPKEAAFKPQKTHAEIACVRLKW